MRNTRQKKAIKEVLGRGEHLSAEDIFNQIKSLIKIDISTVYRNLNIMVENGEIEKIVNSEGVAQYHDKSSHHGHLICLKCNNIFEIPCNLCDKLHGMCSEMDFADKEHIINIYGICKKCKGD